MFDELFLYVYEVGSVVLLQVEFVDTVGQAHGDKLVHDRYDTHDEVECTQVGGGNMPDIYGYQNHAQSDFYDIGEHHDADVAEKLLVGGEFIGNKFLQ